MNVRKPAYPCRARFFFLLGGASFASPASRLVAPSTPVLVLPLAPTLCTPPPAPLRRFSAGGALNSGGGNGGAAVGAAVGGGGAAVGGGGAASTIACALVV